VILISISEWHCRITASYRKWGDRSCNYCSCLNNCAFTNSNPGKNKHIKPDPNVVSNMYISYNDLFAVW